MQPVSKTPAIHINNLTVSYNRTPALTDVCFDVADGEFLGIIGPNGGGKSTLLKAILGLIPVETGTVQIYGEDVKSRQTTIGYVPQFAALDRRFPITVLEVVLTGTLKNGLTPFHRYTVEDRDLARKTLSEVGIEALSGRQISELSGGEFQRMLIARALAVRPKLLLLDEPTASVDAASREQIYALLANLNQHMTIVLVTHDLLAVSSQIQRLACLNGRLVYHGEPELTQDVVNHLYGCPVDLIAHGVPHRVLKEHNGEEHEC
ncbi:MAG TPA: metal ABC transporter ATP-binding protein [Oscillospiraceae bacterium]|nr:metal ABC transporter ATP-binding protein [Oscillospiraceae bacterium]HPK35261.1 metal ABC transporter ATP-binding protein [Oscillospiraceae bacterium]HPR75454.1 metal ABC transporter ATP-binding protein [Oscillospiraceae bacterium]